MARAHHIIASATFRLQLLLSLSLTISLSYSIISTFSLSSFYHFSLSPSYLLCLLLLSLININEMRNHKNVLKQKCALLFEYEGIKPSLGNPRAIFLFRMFLLYITLCWRLPLKRYPSFNVPRFCELLQLFEVLLMAYFSKKCEPSLANLLCNWANFHCGKSP